MTTQPKEENPEKAEKAEEADNFDAEAVSSPAANKATRRDSGCRIASTTTDKMSVVSERYDLENKGHLDETEKMMRQYDKDNDGLLDLREVYKIVEDVRRQQNEPHEDQKKILNLKRVIIAFFVFTIFLTLAMIGVSFAAAILTKDIKTTSSGQMADKRTGQALSTVSAHASARINLDDSDPDADGRSRSLLASSPLGRKMRHIVKQRELLGYLNSRWAKDSDSDEDSEEGGNDVSERDGNDEDDIFDESCNEFEGWVEVEDFEEIRRAARNHHDSVFLDFRSRRKRYSIRVIIDEYLEDRDEDMIDIIGESKKVCKKRRRSRRYRCQDYIPRYTIKNCNRDKCRLYTCLYGLNDWEDEL